MKKLIVMLGAMMALNGAASAVLPPLWQGVAELKSMLNDKRFGETLQSGEVIQEIKKTDNGWRITTNKSEVDVHVVYQHASKPGPAQFVLEFGVPSPITTLHH